MAPVEEGHRSAAMFLGRPGRIITRPARDLISHAERLGHPTPEYAVPIRAQQAPRISVGCRLS
jgi:hypothetical protein